MVLTNVQAVNTKETEYALLADLSFKEIRISAPSEEGILNPRSDVGQLATPSVDTGKQAPPTPSSAILKAVTKVVEVSTDTIGVIF